MKRDGMKIGLFVVLVAASGVLFYNQFGPVPRTTSAEPSPEEEAAREADARVRQAISQLPDYIIAGN